MKKLFVMLLALLMVLTLAGCSKKEETPAAGGEEPTFDVNSVNVDSLKLASTKDYVYADSSEIANMDYVTTALATDHEINANFVDGLVECNSFGAYVGSLAESWSANEDASVWTFNLRKGVKWVTSTGEEYAEVTSEDFVTGLRHAAEFASGTGTIAFQVKGFADYYNGGDWSDEAWANVGISAPDAYTVVYELEESCPYFYTMVEYTVFYPVNKTFLETKGAGCAIGSPDVTACEFGQPVPGSILYCGPFVLSSFDVKSKTVLTKNAAYWDAENVNLDTVTVIYDDGSDPYSVIRGFEQNIYAAAGLSTTWGNETFQAMYDKYDGYVTASLPNAYAFGVVFNYNRVTFNETNYAEDEALRANTRAAILNENFRLALKSAFDVQSYLEVSAPTLIASGTIRNINGVPSLVSTSDGRSYGVLVEEAYAEETGKTVSLADGQWPWLNKEAALAYIEAAKADGIEFPVHVDMLVVETSDRLVKQAQSMKQSVEENTDGQIIIELVMRDADTVQGIAYYTEDWSEADYDISTFTGWGPDYVDPKTFVEIYSPVDGYYMHSCGLTDSGVTGTDDGSDAAIKEAVGFNEYEALYRAADAIKDDLDARYEAFAKADAYLIAHGLYIPTSQQTRSARVSHVVPFTAPFSTGVSQYKLKRMQLQEGIVTAEQYDAAKAAWEAGE